MADLANIAAATAAGYKEVVTLRGNVYAVMLEKYLSGADGADTAALRAYGDGTTQVAAEAQALASLNAQRAERYGRTSAIPRPSTEAAPTYPRVGNLPDGNVVVDAFTNLNDRSLGAFVGAGGRPFTTQDVS